MVSGIRREEVRIGGVKMLYMKKINNDFTDRAFLPYSSEVVFSCKLPFPIRSFLSKFLKFLKSFKFQFMGRGWAKSSGQMLMDSYICPTGPIFTGRLVLRAQGLLGRCLSWCVLKHLPYYPFYI